MNRTHASGNKNDRTATAAPAARSRQRSADHASQPLQRLADGAVHADAGQLLTMQGVTGNQAAIQMMRNSEASATAEQALQRKAGSSPQGRMPFEIQAKMEHAFGADFSDVAIHTESTRASNAGALAYTQGTDIHFAPGQYDPYSSKGQQMLGHELTHVVQQKAGRVKPTDKLSTGQLLNDDEQLEQEADEMGTKAANSTIPGTDAIQRMADKSGAAPTAGKSASLVLQRMPSRQEVVKSLGEPKEHVKNKLAGTKFGKFFKVKENLKENSTRYRAVLDKIDRFEQYVNNTVVGDTDKDMDNQTTQVMALYATVEQAADHYIGDKKADRKTAYMTKLKKAIPVEKVYVKKAIEEFKRNPDRERPEWKLLTSHAPFKDVGLDQSMATGAKGKGGINSVSFFQTEEGDEGVFKETKDVILDEGDLPSTATKEEKDAAGTEAWVARDFAKIDLKDARLAERNVAMSRLDKLLDAGVIARSNFALHRSGKQIQQGTFMVKAQGTTLPKLEESGRIAKNAEEKKSSQHEDAVDVNDPNLQRCLSRLQLIDALALQVDRHYGNFFIQYDKNGKVQGVTGIDNDMAFGKVKGVEKRVKEYPGLSKYVDKELAVRILALKDEDLQDVMADLLSADEIEALLSRLHQLQEHLKKDTTKLLEPGEWDAATAQGMLDERKSRTGDSYYGDFKSKSV